MNAIAITAWALHAHWRYTPNLRATLTSGHFGQMCEVGAGGTARLQRDLSLYAEADYRKKSSGNGAQGCRQNIDSIYPKWNFIDHFPL